uniref:Protein MCM10 homolog n=1 Tax=Branchiostoma floridae TaxID=7739 RepID=C3YPG3_BRAFL|eukprot:XP_002601735.1 hypothetical protein BRAFLDRAFT_76045 [Branchiostoma floridae]
MATLARGMTGSGGQSTTFLVETERSEMDSDDDYPMDYGLDALTSLMDEDDFGNVFDRDEENDKDEKPPTPPPKLSFEDAIAGPSAPQHSGKKIRKTSKENGNRASTNYKSTDGERERHGSRNSAKQSDTDRTAQSRQEDDEDDEANRSKEDLEEELRQMREKMMMLEQQLKKQNSQEDTSPAANKKCILWWLYLEVLSMLQYGGTHGTGTPRPLGPSVKHNRNPTAGVKRELSPSADTLAPKRTKLLESDPVLVDKYSQIRIVNPKISSETLRTKMEGRKMVRMSVIKSHMRNGEIEGDWVTMGVLVKKIPPKTASNGKTFSIWKLSDLRDCSVTISFFLFGEVHKNQWKNDEGTVIGLCNPSIMKARDKGDTDVALTVDNPLKVMVMGRSKDLGYCKATKKGGGQCENFVNKDQCEYCEYHVHSQYKKSKAKRGEFNSVIGPPDPKKKILQKMMGKNESFMYGGHTYTTTSPAAVANKKKTQVNLDFLRVTGARSMDAAVKANIVGKMEKKKDEETLKKLAAPSQAMQELLCAPTVGSMNLIKHLGTEEKRAQPKMKLVSASELLKNHKQEMLDMKKKQQANRQSSEAQGGAAGTSPEVFYPKLGKGLSNSQDIVVFDSPSHKVSSSQKAMAQLEMQEKYFAELEKKERMEDKMATINYVKCKIVTCKKCKYTTFCPSESCKKENHPLVWHDGVKRFFKCMNCSKRCVSLQRYPQVACRSCGSSKFERTTMSAEKKGPTLDSEILNVRGEDEMFLNKL